MEKLVQDLNELKEQHRDGAISDQQYVNGFVNLIKTNREIRNVAAVDVMIYRLGGN